MPITRIQTGSLYAGSGLRKYLTADERRRFLAAANALDRAELRTLCLTLAYTGCRISEALDLRAGHVAVQDGFIAFRTLKRRNGLVMVREVPVPPELLIALSEAHPLSTEAADGRLWRWCRNRAWQLIKAVMAEAGVTTGPQATPKGLRHGFGLHAIRSGVPLNLVQRWLGHARMETTAIYLQALGSEEQEIASRMWQR